MSELIITPEDNENERLRKKLKLVVAAKSVETELQEMVTDPRARHYAQLRDQGFDVETSARIAQLDTMNPDARARIILEYASRYHPSGRSDISRSVTYEVPNAMSNILGTAGHALGAAAGTSLLGLAVKHGKFVGIVAGTAACTAASVAVGRFVHQASGVWAAAGAVISLWSLMSFVGHAWLKVKK